MNPLSPLDPPLQMYVYAAVALFFQHSPVYCFHENHTECLAGADPGFLESGFMCIKKSVRVCFTDFI